MIFEQTTLPGVMLVRQTPHRDERGFFSRLYCPEEFDKAGLDFTPTQINLSRNTHPFTLRGLHYQDTPFAEAKFIRILRGAVHEVVVDLREGSATRYQHLALRLDAEAGDGLFIPEGFAHGFLTLEAGTDMLYQMGRSYVPGCAKGLRWDDPKLAIAWPHVPIMMSDTDKNWPLR